MNIKWSGVFITCLCVFLLSSSCSDGEENRSSVRYSGYIPNFSVNAPQNSVGASVLNLFIKPLVTKIQSLNLEENEINIDCTEALNNWNEAPRLPEVANGSLLCFNNQNCRTDEIGYAIHFYAQSQFYDCNIRQQIRDDGLTRQCTLREGSGGRMGEDNLCDEEASESVQLLYALTQGNPAEDWTRFVSWTMDPNDPATEDVQGVLINKYLQGDGIRTKTRVDLDRRDGKKVVNSTLLVYDLSGEPSQIVRAYFREEGEEGNITDNYIVGRYWQVDYGQVVTIRAHLRSGAGASVFVETCSVNDFTEAQNSACTASGASPVYFDLNDESSTSPIVGLTTSGADVVFDPRDPSRDDLDTFFNAQDIDDYFDEGAFSPENNP